MTPLFPRRNTVTGGQADVISFAQHFAYGRTMPRLTPLSRFLVVCGLLLAGPVSAGITDQDQVLAGGLLPGWRLENGHHMAALDLALAPGWKTYWRSPGEAGIPPQFDWSGSQNVRSVRLHWPAPSVFEVSGMTSIGYHDRLLLPLEVVALDPSRPVILSGRIALGVCLDICVPADLTVSALLETGAEPDAAIRRALAARPLSAAEAGVRAATCTVDPISDGLRVTATLDLPSQGGAETLVIEPGLPDVWVAQSGARRSGRRMTGSADMVADGGPFALDRSAIVVTVIGTQGAVEIRGCSAP